MSDPPQMARVVADTSEPDDLIALLRALGAPVEVRRLAPADYVIGRTAVERKSVGDFQASLVDGRLFEQIGRLRETYEAPILLVVEGDLAFVEEHVPSPRAFWSAMAAVALDPAIHLVPTHSKGATAEVLAALSRWAGQERQHTLVRHKPRRLGQDVEQKFAVQGLPGVGDIMSEKLLARFGSLRNVFAATHADLARTPGIGAKRASEITAFLDRAFANARAPRGEQARLPAASEIPRDETDSPEV